MNSLDVDPPFADTKTKKTTIKREMQVTEKGDQAYLEVTYKASEDEVGSLRTALTSFVANATMICET